MCRSSIPYASTPPTPGSGPPTHSFPSRPGPGNKPLAAIPHHPHASTRGSATTVRLNPLSPPCVSPQELHRSAVRDGRATGRRGADSAAFPTVPRLETRHCRDLHRAGHPASTSVGAARRGRDVVTAGAAGSSLHRRAACAVKLATNLNSGYQCGAMSREVE